jgi:formate dehydrogenase major subunit
MARGDRPDRAKLGRGRSSFVACCRTASVSLADRWRSFQRTFGRYKRVVGLTKLLASWPVVRQLRDGDPLGLGSAVQSGRSKSLQPRIAQADKVAHSVCPFCAVGCAQLVYVQDGDVTQVEGDPASPISRGRLCPKGAATKNMHEGPLREYKVKYRRPHGTAWEELPLDRAMDMIADRIIRTREETWQETSPEGKPARRTMGIANLGGATLDNEENYLIKKLLTGLGIVQVENQARI